MSWSQKNIELKADNDISLTAAALRAEEAVKLTAGNDVLIGAGEETQTTEQAKKLQQGQCNVHGFAVFHKKIATREKRPQPKALAVISVAAAFKSRVAVTLLLRAVRWWPTKKHRH
ncbi:hemagglutinin repeat-containing protein [Pseudomonas lini]